MDEVVLDYLMFESLLLLLLVSNMEDEPYLVMTEAFLNEI